MRIQRKWETQGWEIIVQRMGKEHGDCEGGICWEKCVCSGMGGMEGAQEENLILIL